MSRTTRGSQSIVAAAVGIALGLLPVAALALGANDAAVPPPPPCSPMGAEPLNVPLEPQPEVLKGAPYSGVGTTEVVTTLADGNRITRTNTMRYFRDSQGRTRTEYQLAAIGPFVPEEAQSIVTITDPVAGRHYVLHPGMKRADEFKLGAKGVAARGAGVRGNAIFVSGVFTSVNVGPQPVESVRATIAEPTSGTRARIAGTRTRGGDKSPAMVSPPSFTHSADVRQPMGGLVVHTNEGPEGAPGHDTMVVHSAGGAFHGCQAVDAVKGAKPVSIGERRIEGLKVTGSRLEFTIDAGAVGNEQPITVRTDQWFSPDLGVVVSSLHHDPMIGDTTYRLEQINRVEPDESLFVVPSDYAKHVVGF